MITLFNIRPRGLNIGNDVIAIGLRLFIKQAFGEVVNIISLPATSKYESHAKAGLRPATLHEINQYGHGVIIGGGNLYENGELELNPETLNTLAPPMMLFSLSRGRIYGRKREWTERTDAMPTRSIQALNQKAMVSFARDDATLDFLHKVGATNAVLGGCPTLYLDHMEPQLFELGNLYRDTVFISVRNPQLINVPLDRQAEVRTDILNIIGFLREKGHKDIRLLCHDPRDIPFAASIRDVDYTYVDDAFTFLSLLRACALLVTYRLHSALPSFALNRPCIVVSYDERAISAMRSVGYGDWNIDMVRQDVMAEVRDRYARLDQLPDLRQQAAPVWQGLRETMEEGFGRFARSVIQYRDEVA